MPDSTLSGLRRVVAALERDDAKQASDIKYCFPKSWLSTGHAGIDAALCGGLACGAVHELFTTAPGDAGALRGVAVALAALASTHGRPVLWISEAMVTREAGTLHAPGLALMGADPGRLVILSAPDTAAMLSAAVDAAASGAVAAVVAEAWGSPPALDLTATRRLTLAARRSGTLVVLARLGAKPAPSSAETRWRVAAAPSTAPFWPLAPRVPGPSVLDLTLLRHRRGVSGATWRVAWMCHERKFEPVSVADAKTAPPSAIPPLSGGLAASAADRPAAAKPGRRVLRLAG